MEIHEILRAVRVFACSFFFCLLVACPVLAADGPERLTNPALEARAVALQKELRCVVCQSQSLDESDAPLAADLRKLIREHIEKGESDAQIKDYLVARYGDFILMRPPVEPDTYALWFGPLIALLIGGMSAATVIARAQTRAERARRAEAGGPRSR